MFKDFIKTKLTYKNTCIILSLIAVILVIALAAEHTAKVETQKQLAQLVQEKEAIEATLKKEQQEKEERLKKEQARKEASKNTTKKKAPMFKTIFDK